MLYNLPIFLIIFKVIMPQNTIYKLCKDNFWKEKADKLPKVNLAKKRILIIEIADYSKKSFDDTLIKVLQANKFHIPFAVISPDSTAEQRAHIKNTCKKLKLFRDVCSIIFTSGSTGKPKPIQWTNKMAIKHCLEKARFFNLKKTDRFANAYLVNSLGGLSDFFMCCVIGTDFVFMDRNEGDEGMIGQIIEQKITAFNATPSFWNKFNKVMSGQKEKLNLTAYIVGGNFHENLIQNLSKYVRKILTAYGMTEAFGAIGVDMYKKNKPSSAGQAVRGSKIEIIDKGEECRQYENGEIVISGELVSPSCQNPYYTGDIGYKDKDSDLFIIGRKDGQIKVGGFRVNFSQYISTYNKYKAGAFSIIDPKTNSHEVAMVFETTESPRKIIKYVNDTPPPVSQYCRPKWIFTTKKLPMTTSGLTKIDTLKLKELFLAKIEKLKNKKIKKNKKINILGISGEIVKIWQKILKRDNINLNTNFFSAGGNSVTAIQVINQINKRFGLNISVVRIFDNPTPKKITFLIMKK